jgi:hypothetical protein
MPLEIQSKIARAVSGIHGVAEAHLPQCYAKGFADPPAQILVLVLEPATSPSQVMPQIQKNLRGVLPAGKFLDIFPLLPDSPWLPTVRMTNTKLVI